MPPQGRQSPALPGVRPALWTFPAHSPAILTAPPAAWYYSHMHPSLTTSRKPIADLCRRYHVRRLELFGSAAGDRYDPNVSDVDFLVEFEPLADGAHADAYFGLLAELESLLARPVDLVMTRAIRNPYFLEAIEPTRTLIYAA